MMRSIPFVTLLAACGGQSQDANFPLPDHKATLEMFVMSQCPYGVQVEQAITPVKQKLGGALDVKINYIGKNQDGELTSMHGPNEVAGDIVQLCAAKQAPEKLLDFVGCQNEAMKQVAENWKDCGSNVGLDVAALESCMTGEEGKGLLAASFELAQSKGARSSPTMFLDGEPYKAGRKTNDFMREICKTYGDQAPPPCKEIPEPPVVNAVFLSDDRCEECDIRPLEEKLKGQLGGLKVTHLDVKSDEGKALYEKVQGQEASFKYLPAVLITTSELEKDAEGKGAIARFLQPLGESGYTSLKLGAKFDPKAEICDNTTDDDADGLADCADDGCSAQLICREAIPGKLDLFVMSQCPYGAKALIAANDVIDAFGGGVDLDVHFIGDNKDGKLSSMHGQSEVDHDIREVCAQSKYPNDYQFLDYMACISRDYKKVDWKTCAAEAKMDPNVIQSCFDGEGNDLLAKSFAVAEELSIGSSPTFLSNNKRTFNAIAADALQKEICKDNPELKGCSAIITTDAAAAAPVPAGACE